MRKDLAILGLVFALVLLPTASAQTLKISPAGKTSLQNAAVAPGSDNLSSLELAPDGSQADLDTPNTSGGVLVNRTIAKNPGVPASVNGGKKPKSNPIFQINFNGLDHRDQRLANGGNQFSLEPPDQGLCAGNGFVMESVNDAIRVFDTGGHPLTGVIALNTFYGYPPAINRSTGVYGVEVTDPSCYFDPDSQRWFQVALSLPLTPHGAFTGVNTLDLAVSDTSSPLGSWTIYRIHAENNGTNGTPDHQCPGGFCLGDYPHIGADSNGIYLTTNEFPFFAGGFNGAQVYALSKSGLVAGGVVNGQLFNTGDASYLFEGAPGFTVWPAVAPNGNYQGNTEFFLSSLAVFSDQGFDNRLRLWTIKNTQSLNSDTPAVVLSSQIVKTTGYAVPPRSTQKSGDWPLGQCINDTTSATPFGLGCWRFLFAAEPKHVEVLSRLDSNDSRMQQVVYANGKLWGALDTGVTFDGIHALAGIAYFVINPNSGNDLLDGYVAVPNNNVTYPAVAVSPSGRGAMAFTLVGPDFYPSAAYSNVDDSVGVSDLFIASPGSGPQDGFSGYRAYAGGGNPRPRWGDYGAAVYDNGNIWLASEFIGQTCTLAQYMSPFGSCGATRTSLANWGTSITAVSVK